ncbi:tyrosine-type recombinase/integrase [Mycobacterium sp. MBM]|nr:tyrosine-type recombinase/integrase [Mycobacterium sp. MBM]
MRISGDHVTVLDEATTETAPVVVVEGSLEFVDQWLRERAIASGPARIEMPAGWQEWVELFLAEQRGAHRAEETIATRLAHLRAFALAHPGVTPVDVTRDQLLAWIGRRTVKPRTAHSIRSTMRVFFRVLRDLDHRGDDPARTLPAISLPRSLPRPCPDHAVRAVYETVSDERLLLAIRVMVETGMRRREVVRIHPDDVAGRAGDYRLHVVGKGDHERWVPIGDDLADRILAHRGYLFAGRGSKPVTARHLGKQIAAALPGVWTAHTLRHRFATAAYQATSDLRAVQELLGHSSPDTTAIYTQIGGDAMRRAAQAAALQLGD